MQKISVCVPCYNEEKNIENAYKRIRRQLDRFETYHYEIIFIDNNSQDNSRIILRAIAKKDKRFKVILNTRNFGAGASANYVLYQATGDAIIYLPCDMQEPPELLGQFIEEWEKGYKVVMGQKTTSKEKGIMQQCRKFYYWLISKTSDISQYKQVTAFGLYDKTVVNEMKRMDDRTTRISEIIAELGYKVSLIPYEQQLREYGKSSCGVFQYVSMAIGDLIRVSQFPIRCVTIMGITCSFISFFIGLIYFVYKLINWTTFNSGVAPIAIGLFFLGSLQLLFIGIIGEYVGEILNRVIKRPLIVEEERINFSEDY